MLNKIKQNKKLFRLLRYIIPIILVVWMIIINPWQDFADRLANVPFYLILIGVAINFGLIFSLKAWRWRIAIPKPPSFFKIYASQLEGQLANILIGMGVADFVRSSRLRKDEEGTFPEDFGTAVAGYAIGDGGGGVGVWRANLGFTRRGFHQAEAHHRQYPVRRGNFCRSGHGPKFCSGGDGGGGQTHRRRLANIGHQMGRVFPCSGRAERNCLAVG